MKKETRKGKNNTKKKDKIRIDPIILATIIISAIVLCVMTGLVVYRNSNAYLESQTAVSVGDTKINAREYTFYYNDAYNRFVTYYYNNLYSYYGDLSAVGLSQGTDLTTKQCPFSENQTWAEFLADWANDYIETVIVNYEEGKKAGFEADVDVHAGVENAIASVQAEADKSSKSLKDYLEAIYAGKVDENLFRELVAKNEYATLYEQHKRESKEVTTEEIDAYYAENKSKFDNATYGIVSFPFAAEGEEAAEGEDAKDTAEQAKTKADELLASVKDKTFEEFKTIAGEDATINEDTAISSISDTKVSEWLIDSARVEGETAIIEADSTYYVIYFVKTYLDDYNLNNARVIYIPAKIEDENSDVDALMAEAKQTADTAYAEWEAGEKTEDNFSSLVTKYSGTSSDNGGLYEDIYKGALPTPITDWLLAEKRTKGDTTFIEDKDGNAYYIVYYVSEGEPYWTTAITANIKNDTYTAWYEEVSASYTMEKDNEVIKKVTG